MSPEVKAAFLRAGYGNASEDDMKLLREEVRKTVSGEKEPPKAPNQDILVALKRSVEILDGALSSILECQGDDEINYRIIKERSGIIRRTVNNICKSDSYHEVDFYRDARVLFCGKEQLVFVKDGVHWAINLETKNLSIQYCDNPAENKNSFYWVTQLRHEVVEELKCLAQEKCIDRLNNHLKEKRSGNS